MDIKPIVVNVETGNFYIEDAKFYHYSEKNTKLAEDITKYRYIYPGHLGPIHSVTVPGLPFNPFPIGYGSDYSIQYGGLFNTTSNGTVIDLFPKHGPDKLFIPTGDMYVKITADERTISPSAVINAASNETIDVYGTLETRQLLNLGYESPTPNFFNKNTNYASGETYNLSVSQESPYYTNGTLKTNDPAKGYSFDIVSSNEFSDLADIMGRQASGEPLQIICPDANVLEFVRDGDLIEMELPIEYREVWHVEELDTLTARENVVYHIKDRKSTEYGKYARLLPGGVLAISTTAPCLVPVRVRLIATTSGGNVYSGNVLYAKFESSIDPTLFTTRVFEFIPSLISFWGGIPKWAILHVNQIILTIDVIADNKGYIKGADQYSFMSDTNVDLSWLNYNSSPIATLMGGSCIYRDDIEIPFYLFNKMLTLPKEAIKDRKVIVTDWLASEMDITESLGTEFKIDRDGNLIVNRTKNLLSNPTFLSVTASNEVTNADGWFSPNASGEIDCIRDSGRVDSVLHERSYKLIAADAKVFCLVPNVDPSSDLCLTFYSKGDSELSVKYYALDNQGSFYKTTPNITNSGEYNDNVIGEVAYSTFTPSRDFSKYTARIINTFGSYPTEENELSLSVDGTTLPEGTTDILVEFSKVSGTSSIYISAPQLSYALFPAPYSHDYDLGTVEYDINDLSYGPRFLVSSMDNPINSGYLAFDVYDNEIDDNFVLEDLFKSSIRRAAYNVIKRKIYGKETGANKWIQTSSFALDRTPFKGEHFTKPEIFQPAAITIVGDPIYISQSSIYQKAIQKPINIVLEDKNGKNIVGTNVLAEIGFKEGVLLNIDKVSAMDDGIIRVIPPEVSQESIYRYETFAPLGSADTADEYLFTPYSNGITVDMPSGTVFCLVYSDATCSRLYTTTVNLVIGEYLVNSINYTTVTSSDPLTTEDSSKQTAYVWILPSYTNVPTGFVKWPNDCSYDIDVNSLGSAVMSYYSTFDNQFITARGTVAGYASSGILRASFRTEKNYARFTINQNRLNIDFRRCTIRNTNYETITYARSNNLELQPNGYYFDAENNYLYINDIGCDTILIDYKPRMIVSANGADLYMHRSMMLEPFQHVNSKILASTSFMAVPGLMANATRTNWQDFTFYMKPYINVKGYITASLGSISNSSTIIYTHTKLN